MATILSERPTGDGYDVRFLTAGQAHTLHFASPPSEADLAAALTAFETRLLDAAVDETEEGHELFEQ